MIILHNKQSECIKSNKRYKLLNWGRRSGKTSVIAYEALIDLYNNDKALVSYYAPTTTDARDIAWEIFKETLDKLIIKTNEVLLEIKVRNKFGGESTLRLAGWEAVKNRDKGRGVENTLVILDEVAFYPEFKEKFEKVIEPTLLTSKGRLILTSTPNGFNHFYDKYNEALNNDMWFVSHATSYDNPKNDPEELARLRKEKDQDVFAQEYMADFRKIQGLVYKDFDRERHTYDPDTAKINKINEIAGIDWGYTNPLTMLRIYVDNDNNFFIHDEYYRTEKTTEEAIEFLGTWKPTCVYPDPAEPDRNAMVAKAGYYVKDVNKDIKSGVDKVISLFRNNKIFISKACINLINELESYRYDEKLSKEIPVKENDHACFTIDTKIEVPFGEIVSKKSTGFKDVYEFMGSKVTADHPYLTQRGFVCLDSLRYDDRIVIWKNKLLMEYHLDDTQNLRGIQIKTILYLLQRNLQAIKLNISTDIYGRNIMERYLRASIYTIKTVIQLTTTYLTSNVYHLKNIIENTIRRIYLNGKIILNLPVKVQVSGLKQIMGSNSEANGGEKVQSIFQDIKFKETVTNAESNTLLRPSLGSSATIIAKLKHLGKEEVFATKTTSGFFMANGVVVSNCDSLRYALFMHTGSIPVVRNQRTSTPKVANKAL